MLSQGYVSGKESSSGFNKIVFQMIYLDFAASAPMRPEALEAYGLAVRDSWGNASSSHAQGRLAKRALSEARESIASCVGAQPEELVFVASGTEAANLAIKGAMAASGRRRILCSSVEHPAVIRACESVAASSLVRVPTDSHGQVSREAVAELIDENTALVCVQLVNNELATIQPIKSIAEVCKEVGSLLFVDAVQGLGKLPIDLNDLGCSMAGFSAHKVGGPLGIGALWVKRGVKIEPLNHGGGQERTRRSGTEAVPLAAAFARGVELSVAEMPSNAEAWMSLGQRLHTGLEKASGNVTLTGHPVERAPHIASFVVQDVQGSDVVILLDQQGICAGGGSACASGAPTPSSVLLACGYSSQRASGALRFSFGPTSTEKHVDAVLDVLPPIIRQLRAAKESAPAPT